MAKFKTHTQFELVIFREKKDGTMGMAKPCAHCVQMLKKVGKYGINIKRVSYTMDDGSYETCAVSELENDFLTSGTRRINFLNGESSSDSDEGGAAGGAAAGAKSKKKRGKRRRRR